MEEIDRLKNIIKNSKKIVFFGGAGVSTGSGIKDFRSSDGLYSKKGKYDPEEILSHDFFFNHTDLFYEFYKKNLNPLGYKPNICHLYLKELEDNNKLLGIITQNIDGLHEFAGSTRIFNLHGSVYSNTCLNCNKKYDAEYVFNSKGIPKCTCGGIIKPDVVLYNESLNIDTLNDAVEAVSMADTLIICGTSLVVYPAASLINYFRGNNIIIINRDNTPYDYMADIVIHDDIVKVFNELKKK